MVGRILAFVGDVYEDLELWYPKLRLEEAGYVTHLAAKKCGNSRENTVILQPRTYSSTL